MSTSQKTTRREFLHDSLRTGAAVGLTAAVAGLTPLGSPGVHAAGSDMMKIGVIGCGGRGCGAVVDAMKAVPNVRLVAMADTFEDRARNARESLKKGHGDRMDVPDERLFSGLDGYKGVIESSDAVLIACGSRFHPHYTISAVEAKKHVFVEKPHALDAAGIKLVEKAAEIAKANNTALVSGLCYRYDTLRQEAFRRIADGEIGDITSVQCDYVRSPYSLVSRKDGWTETEYQFRNWYHFTWLAGDEILQSLLHNIDSVMTAFGDEAPVSAYGIGGRSSMFIEEMGDMFDNTAMILSFADGKKIYGMTRCAKGCFTSNTDVLHGTKGRCIFKATGKPMFTDLKGRTTWIAGERQRGMYEQEHYEMFTSIAAGKPINDGYRMARTTMAGILGFIACRSGQQILWNEALESAAVYGPKESEISLDMEPPIKPDEKGLYPLCIPGRTAPW